MSTLHDTRVDAPDTDRLTYRSDGRLTELAFIGRVLGGQRIDAPFAGSIVSGQLAGATSEGVLHVLLRRDHTGLVDLRERILLPSGGCLAVRAGGHLHPVPHEGLEAGPAIATFTWPPPFLELRGSATVRADGPGSEGLARTLVPVRGLLDLAGRRVVTEGLGPR